MEHLDSATQEGGERLVLIGNIIQVQLAERYKESITDFTEKHAKDFRHVLDAHPEYLTRFEHDAEETLQNIEAIIYH